MQQLPIGDFIKLNAHGYICKKVNYTCIIKLFTQACTLSLKVTFYGSPKMYSVKSLATRYAVLNSLLYIPSLICLRLSPCIFFVPWVALRDGNSKPCTSATGYADAQLYNCTHVIQGLVVCFGNDDVAVDFTCLIMWCNSKVSVNITRLGSRRYSHLLLSAGTCRAAIN